MKQVKINISQNPKLKSDGICIEFNSIEELGILLPFQLYIPDNMSDNTTLILANRTPYRSTSDFNTAVEECKYNYTLDGQPNLNIGPFARKISEKFAYPILCPTIPRLAGLDTSYLGYKTYHNDFTGVIEQIQSGRSNMDLKDLEKFKNLDKQVKKMIDFSIDYIRKMDKIIDDKVIVTGYSAASKFSSYFSALHPDKVKAIIAGGTGGLNILPIKKYNGYTLNYPIGINDIEDFSLEKFSKIKQFYFMGSDDYNDVAIPRFEPNVVGKDEKGKPIYEMDECGNIQPKLDKKGKPIYILDGNGNMQAMWDDGYYTNYQIEAINKGIADNTQDRFDIVKKIYNENKINAIFKKYPGNHKTVFDNQTLFEDIFEFIES